MKLRVPHYYNMFTCTGTTCSDNCCRGKWGIDIDDETAEYYLGLTGDLGDKLRSHIAKTDDGCCFIQENGACAFLCDDNLCGIYKTLGPEHMGVVCSQFPRFTEYYGKIKETGIGLACEEAARLILSDREKFTLNTTPIDEEDFESDEFDSELADMIFKLRSLFINLSDVSYLTLNDKLAIMLLIGHKIQELITVNDFDAADKYIQTVCELYDENELAGFTFAQMQEIINKSEIDKNEIHGVILSFLDHTEAYDDDWTTSMDKTKKELKIDCMGQFMAYIKAQGREFEYNNLLKYFLYRYFAKSIFNYDVFGMIQFLIYCMTLILDIDLVTWLESGDFTWEDRMRNIHIFSRQVEYDPEMLNSLTEDFLFEDAFHVENLLHFLM